MKVGLYITTQFTPETDVAVSRTDMIEQVRLARQSGFSSLWVPHHYATQPMQMLAPIPMLAYLAREAEGMMIGPNILVMPLLNPIHVAEDAVTLDLLSGALHLTRSENRIYERRFLKSLFKKVKAKNQQFPESVHYYFLSN